MERSALPAVTSNSWNLNSRDALNSAIYDVRGAQHRGLHFSSVLGEGLYKGLMLGQQLGAGEMLVSPPRWELRCQDVLVGATRKQISKWDQVCKMACRLFEFSDNEGNEVQVCKLLTTDRANSLLRAGDLRKKARTQITPYKKRYLFAIISYNIAAV